MNIPKYQVKLEAALDSGDALAAFAIFKDAFRNGIRFGNDLSAKLYHSLIEIGPRGYVPAQLFELQSYLFD